MCLVFIAVACGGSECPEVSESAASEGSEVGPAPQETAPPTLEIAAPEPPEPDAEALERAARDCDKACRLVTACLPDVPLDQCVKRCQQSRWIEGHATRCLALRIFWIDEEGCPRIAPTWQLFDDADDCSGPPPDSR